MVLQRFARAANNNPRWKIHVRKKFPYMCEFGNRKKHPLLKAGACSRGSDEHIIPREKKEDGLMIAIEEQLSVYG